MAMQKVRERAVRRFAVGWFAWWALMMSFWVAIDDSLRGDELAVGAGAAALAAAAAVVVGDLAQVRAGYRSSWWPAAIAGVLELPGRVVKETLLVFGALGRTLARGGRPPRGGFRDIPVRYGDDTPSGQTRRILLTGARSLAPNAFVVEFDRDRGAMTVHELVRGS
jgi:multisubunit Na+/H+ antiporter MnhE subunit